MFGATFQNMTFINSKICEGCGEEVEIYELVVPFGPAKGERITIKIGCRCEELQMIRQIEEEQRRSKIKKMQALFNTHSLISRKLQKANFENYTPLNESQERAKKLAMRYAESFDPEKGKSLLLIGGYGVGKSHLAKSITDRVMEKGYSAIFISVPKLLTKFKSTYHDESEFTEQELIDALNEVDLLVLDDIGAENTNDWTTEKLFEIVDTRQGMNNIYTSNDTPEGLMKKLGERNFSRILNDDTILIHIQGENYRLRKFFNGA